jgi:hypothetical protein
MSRSLGPPHQRTRQARGRLDLDRVDNEIHLIGMVEGHISLTARAVA